MKSRESHVVILSLPNCDVSQGGAAKSSSLLKAVSYQQKHSFIIMNEGAGDLFTMPFPWVV